MFSSTLVDQILDVMPVARLSQLDGDGHPQALPFVFVRIGQSLWSPIDGKPKKSRRLARLDWIEQHPQVCVLLDHYDSQWDALWWLKLFGQAQVIEGDHPDWNDAVSKLSTKYPQYENIAIFSGSPTMVRFAWDRYKSWAASPEERVLATLATV